MDDLIGLLPVLAVAALIISSLVGAAVKVVQEYERGVIFRLGRLVGARGPGLFFIIPFIERMVKIDLRTVTLDIPSQEVITSDNVTVRVNAVAYFRVIDPEAAVVRVADYMLRHHRRSPRPRMRSVLGQSELDELLSQPRGDQPAAPADHRRADRAMGHQGQHRRGQGRRAAAGDAARHGPPGRGRAREARQGDPRRGRVPGRASSCPRRRTSSARRRRRSSCATSRRWATSARTRRGRSSSRCRWT